MCEVKIGATKYKVTNLQAIDPTAQGVVMGEVDYPECLITLLGPLNRARKEETLIHEVLHAIFFEAGYLEHSEEMVDRLTPFLYSFIKENNLDKLFDEVNRN